MVVGEHDLAVVEGEEETFSVREWISHPSYRSLNSDYDYAILKLDSHISFSPSVSPVCLPSGVSFGGQNGTVTGWGTTEAGGSQPDLLQEAVVRILHSIECYAPGMLYLPSDITTRMICAAEPGKDACQGDSGGPLITLEVSQDLCKCSPSYVDFFRTTTTPS